MKMLLLLLIMIRLLLIVGAVPVPVFTIYSPDGDLVDCVKVREQPTLRSSFFKTHKILDLPTDMPYRAKNCEVYGWQVWHRNGSRCPEGSAPIRRIKPYQTETPSLSSEERATNGHEYAVGYLQTERNIYGTEVTMNVWQPTIEKYEEFSLAQTWLTSGSYETNDLNSIEAGWQVSPTLYSDYQPRFFIFWTTDAYNNTRCYNIRCPGFVQISRTVMVEGDFNMTSVLGGAQVDWTIRVWMDQKLKCWWLGIIFSNGVLEPDGYWPTIIFTHLIDHAKNVKWGGEITNRHSFGGHTKTQMGSGFYPEAGFGGAAYMRNVKIATRENVFESVPDLVVGASHPAFYHANFSKSERHDFETHFYYGGPEQIPPTHGSGFYVSCSLILVLLCLLLWFV